MISIYLIAVAVSWGTYRMFKEADSYLRKEKKKELANWLLSQKNTQNSLINPFLDIFDKIFSKKHFSLRCFFLSSLFSTIIFSITYYIYYKINYENVADFDLAGIDILKDILPFILIFTIIPDYLSLLETRFILGLMKKTKGGIKKLLLLMLDFVLTFGIIAIFLTIGTKMGHNYLMSDLYFYDFMESWYSIPVQDKVEFAGTPKADWKISFPFSVFVYSAFFTSFWIWIYLFAALIIKLLFLPKVIIKKTLKYFDVRKSPLSIIGFVFSAILLLIFFICLSFGHLLSDSEINNTQTENNYQFEKRKNTNPNSLERRYPNLLNSNYYTSEQIDTLKLYNELYIYLSQLKNDSLVNDIFDLKGIFNLNKKILLIDYQLAFKLNDTLRYKHKMDLVSGKSYYQLTDDSSDKRWQKMSTYFKKDEWSKYSLLRIVKTKKYLDEEKRIQSFIKNPMFKNQTLIEKLKQILLHQLHSQRLLVEYLNSNSQKLNPKSLGIGLEIKNSGFEGKIEKFRRPYVNAGDARLIILEEIRKI